MLSHSFTSTKPAAILIEAAAFSLSSWAVLVYFFSQYSGVFVSFAAIAGATLSIYRIITHYLDRKEIKRLQAAELAERKISERARTVGASVSELNQNKKAAEARERRRL